MITISLCMIVKDEQEVLARCLNSVRDAVDEIIIVDTGSSDGTKDVAKTYADIVADYEWADDFSQARNYAFSLASMQYVMWLDADDVLLPGDRDGLLSFKGEFRADADYIMMRYNTGFDESGNVTMSFYRERLLRRSMNPAFVEPVHEVVPPFGRELRLDVAVTHKKEKPAQPGRNLRIYEKLLAGGNELSPRGMYYYARELFDAHRFEDAAAEFRKFLDGGKGWHADCVEACVLLSQCYERLGERSMQLNALLDSMYYDNPRARVLCEIGRWFMAEARFGQAAFWYEQALVSSKPEHGFFYAEEYGYIPHIQLCVCHYRLGDKARAIEHNEQAALCRPDSPAVAYNREYFSQAS